LARERALIADEERPEPLRLRPFLRPSFLLPLLLLAAHRLPV
jgi:hypothetical protein